MATMLCAVTAKAQEIPNPEPVRDQKAVYDAAANTVTLTGRAPSKTEFDWEWNWTTNEVTIYWNTAALFVTGYLCSKE